MHFFLVWFGVWGGAVVAGTVPPTEFNARVEGSLKGCTSFFHFMDQKNCSSCCAAAIATSLSMRTCLRDGRNVVFSGQQLWDCGGGNCQKGVVLDVMVDSLGVQTGLFVDAECAPLLAAEPNRTRCLSTSCPHTASTVMGGVARYDASYFRGNPDYTALVAGRAMMEEIMENGPVVSVLKLSVDDFQRFSDWKGEQHVFVANATATRSVWHCVVVYGWGQDARSGHNYWLVHNSYGVQWGDMGTARVARGGALELEWRGLYTIPSPPASTAVVKTEHRAPLSLPNTDIVVVTFVSCMLLALLLLYFLSKTKRMF